jgi:4-carboxymuconolactone decarboxylase
MSERFALRSYEQLPPEVRPLADDILKVSSAGLGGPYNALLRSPEMARRCFDLLDYLRFKTSVPKALNELAILIQARVANAQYEWWAHEPIAVRAGLPQSIADDLRQCKRPQHMDESQALVYDFCVQITLNHQVNDALWQKALDRLGEQQVIDLIVVSGTYTMVSMLLNATQVGIPNQGREPLEVMSPETIRRQLLA